MGVDVGGVPLSEHASTDFLHLCALSVGLAHRPAPDSPSGCRQPLAVALPKLGGIRCPRASTGCGHPLVVGISRFGGIRYRRASTGCGHPLAVGISGLGGIR